MKKIALFAILFAFASLFSCRTHIQYVPVEKVRTDSFYLNTLKIDTTYVRDSIRIHERGDTVTIYKDRYVYKFKSLTDTMYINHVDSVAIPYPVEKKLTKWQQTKVNYGGWAMGVLVVLILIVFGRFIYKLRS